MLNYCSEYIHRERVLRFHSTGMKFKMFIKSKQCCILCPGRAVARIFVKTGGALSRVPKARAF